MPTLIEPQPTATQLWPGPLQYLILQSTPAQQLPGKLRAQTFGGVPGRPEGLPHSQSYSQQLSSWHVSVAVHTTPKAGLNLETGQSQQSVGKVNSQALAGGPCRPVESPQPQE